MTGVRNKWVDRGRGRRALDRCAELQVYSFEVLKEASAVVIKADIVRRVADRLEITKVQSEQAVDAVFVALKSAMKEGERIELRGFGVFVVKPRKSGIGRNPRTGAEVPIPPGKTVRFKPGKEIRFNGA